jgi:hypothetical protein
MTSVALPASRVQWLDHARCLSIVLIVLLLSSYALEGIVATGPVAQRIDLLRPFRLPALFFLSGLFLGKMFNTPWRDFAHRRLLRNAYFYALWATIEFAARIANRRTAGSEGSVPNRITTRSGRGVAGAEAPGGWPCAAHCPDSNSPRSPKKTRKAGLGRCMDFRKHNGKARIVPCLGPYRLMVVSGMRLLQCRFGEKAGTRCAAASPGRRCPTNACISTRRGSWRSSQGAQRPGGRNSSSRSMARGWRERLAQW